VFLDSSSTTHPRKNYTKLKKVLDSGLCCFALKGGIVKKPIRKSGKMVFGYKTEFPCLKQLPNSMRDAYYVILHMRDFIRDHQQVKMQSDLDKWGKDLANSVDDALRLEFYCIQQSFATIIY
jgi:hypothetical protein